MNGKMSMQAEREVPLLMQRKPVATLNEYTGKPVMKSALWAYESAAIAAHEIPPDGGTKAARCAAYSAFTGVKAEFANADLSMSCNYSSGIFQSAYSTTFESPAVFCDSEPV